MNRFLHETFTERASVFSLKELLEEIVTAREILKKYRDSTVMRDMRGTPPTSHFYISPELKSLLSSLELNFFLTKYYEMNDRDGHRVSVFALSFGLCSKVCHRVWSTDREARAPSIFSSRGFLTTHRFCKNSFKVTKKLDADFLQSNYTFR